MGLAQAVAGAWAPGGHRAVGAIADELLKGGAAEVEVRSILGATTLRQASVWPTAQRE